MFMAVKTPMLLFWVVTPWGVTTQKTTIDIERFS
jgi:hypothetical protein